MLSDRERIVLNDIERQLGDEDPELAERLTGSPDTGTKPAWSYWVAAAVVGLLVLITIGADMPVATLVLAMALCGIVGWGYFRSRRLHGK